jgi:hypothetical protein
MRSFVWPAAVVIVLAIVSAQGCAARAPESRKAEAMNEPIATVWRTRCGACHRRVEPHSVGASHAEEALARHRNRVRLSEEQLIALESFIAKPAAAAKSSDAP